jgi:hypothetical protein
MFRSCLSTAGLEQSIAAEAEHCQFEQEVRMPLNPPEGSPYGPDVEVQRDRHEGLRHTITLVQGANAGFSLTDGSVVLVDNRDEPIAPKKWQVTWRPTEQHVPDQRHWLQMDFAVAVKYGWKIELLDSNGDVAAVVRDVRYTATAGTKTAFDTIDVFLFPRQEG